MIREGNKYSFINDCIIDSTIKTSYATPKTPPPTITNVSTLNCWYFTLTVVSGTNKYGCYSCKHGYTGKVYYYGN